MAFTPTAIAYYAFHVTSLPLSLLLFIIYKNHKFHSVIAYFGLTLILSSINSCYLAFAKNGDITNTTNTLPCQIQAFFISYLHSSTAIWPVCIESSMTLILLKRRRQQQMIWARKQILFSFMALAWVLPLFFTIASFVLAMSEDGLKPWKFYCMLSEPAIGPAIGIYFVSLCAIIATIIISAWNVKLICDESEEIEFSKRIIAFGIIVTLPVCIATLTRSFNALINNNADVKGTFPDFLLVTVPYLTFIIFGTSPELISKILPKSSPCKRNRGDSLLLRFSIINPALRRETMDEREQRASLTMTTLEEQTTYSSTPGPSSFSQRTDPNAPDPFTHRKNPSLTVNVSQNNNNNNRNNSRRNKGKGRSSVSIRQSFLARALSISKEPDYSPKIIGNGNRNLQKAMRSIKQSPRRLSNRFSSMLNNNRISPSHFEGKQKYFKTFSFENRKKTESVIGIPPEYVVDGFFNNVPEFPKEFRKNYTRNSDDYEEMKEERENERRERYQRKGQLLSKNSKVIKPPPLALGKKSLPSNPKSPSFFFLNPVHYENDQYTDLPVTPSFGSVASSSKVQNGHRHSLSSKSNKSNKSNHSNHSMNSSKSSHGGGLRLTPRNSIPVNILNRKSLIDALPR